MAKVTHTETVTEEKVVVDDYLCNRCGHSCRRGDNYHGLLDATFHGVFGSAIGDMRALRFSLCEPCLSDLFASFKIKPWDSWIADRKRPLAPVAQQIADLRGPVDMGEHGTKLIPSFVLDWAEEALVGAVGRGVPVPYIYPMPEGGVRAEWTAWSVEMSASFTAAGLLLFSVDYAVATDNAREVECARSCDAPREIAVFVLGLDRSPHS